MIPDVYSLVAGFEDAMLGVWELPGGTKVNQSLVSQALYFVSIIQCSVFI